MAAEVTELYNIFVGHNWDYSDHFSRLTKSLDRMKEVDEKFDFINLANYDTSTLDSDNPVDLKNALRKQIDKADVTLILTDLYHENSEWLDQEIDISKEMNVPVILIRSWDRKETPSELEERVDEVTYFESEEIIQSIRKVSEGEAVS